MEKEVMDFSDILGPYKPCQICGKEGAERYRQHTFYANEESNWVTLCEECKKENNEYWAERWSEYYSQCM
jgi:hypothetical protein